MTFRFLCLLNRLSQVSGLANTQLSNLYFKYDFSCLLKASMLEMKCEVGEIAQAHNVAISRKPREVLSRCRSCIVVLNESDKARNLSLAATFASA